MHMLKRISSMAIVIILSLVALAFIIQGLLEAYVAWTEPVIDPLQTPGVIKSAPILPLQTTPMTAWPRPVSTPRIPGDYRLSSDWPSSSMRPDNAGQIELLSMLLGYDPYAGSVAFSPDGHLLAVGAVGVATVVEVPSWNEVFEFSDLDDEPYSVSFSSEGDSLALGSYDGDVVVLDPLTGRKIIENWNATGWTIGPRYTGNGGFLLVPIVEAGRMTLRDATSSREFATTIGRIYSSPGDTLTDFALSPDARFVATSASDGTLKLWNVTTGQEVRAFDVQHQEAWCLSFSPDGRLLAAGFRGEVKLWDVDTGRPLHTLQGHKGRVWELAFSSDGRLLASGAEDWSVRLYDVEKGQELRMFGHGGEVYTVAFSPDQRFLASGSREGVVRLWGIK